MRSLRKGNEQAHARKGTCPCGLNSSWMKLMATRVKLSNGSMRLKRGGFRQVSFALRLSARVKESISIRLCVAPTFLSNRRSRKSLAAGPTRRERPSSVATKFDENSEFQVIHRFRCTTLLISVARATADKAASCLPAD